MLRWIEILMGRNGNRLFFQLSYSVWQTWKIINGNHLWLSAPEINVNRPRTFFDSNNRFNIALAYNLSIAILNVGRWLYFWENDATGRTAGTRLTFLRPKLGERCDCSALKWFFLERVWRIRFDRYWYPLRLNGNFLLVCESVLDVRMSIHVIVRSSFRLQIGQHLWFVSVLSRSVKVSDYIRSMFIGHIDARIGTAERNEMNLRISMQSINF